MAAIAWQQALFGNPIAFCAICGRTLTNPTSVQIGIGPICRSHRKGYNVDENKFGTIVADDLPGADVDGVLQYEPWPGNRSYCRLRIYRRQDLAIVVLTEQPDNPGMSVTNWIEVLATMVAKTYGLDPAKTMWVEHYPNAYYRGILKTSQGEKLDRVTFRWDASGAHDPQWSMLLHIDNKGSIVSRRDNTPTPAALLGMHPLLADTRI